MLRSVLILGLAQCWPNPHLLNEMGGTELRSIQLNPLGMKGFVCERCIMTALVN